MISHQDIASWSFLKCSSGWFLVVLVRYGNPLYNVDEMSDNGIIFGSWPNYKCILKSY